MAYPPFKMRGHELPGPNQRQPDELLGPGSEVLAQDTQQNTVNEQPNNELSNDMSTTGIQGPGAKKNVDIEVTVNGQKV
tara:strand:- start:213 stop:449 length:237 start_codon:yes stop_codon:yes gene_type:complete